MEEFVKAHPSVIIAAFLAVCSFVAVLIGVLWRVLTGILAEHRQALKDNREGIEHLTSTMSASFAEMTKAMNENIRLAHQRMDGIDHRLSHLEGSHEVRTAEAPKCVRRDATEKAHE